VDGGGAGFVIHGYIVGGKSKYLIVDLLSSVLHLCFASEQSVLCLFYSTRSLTRTNAYNEWMWHFHYHNIS
jgi:hypothetical protein